MASLPFSSSLPEVWSLLEQPHDGQTWVVVAQNDHHALELYHQLRFFSPDCDCLYIPAWELLPFDTNSPHPSIIAQRIQASVHLLNHPPAYVILSALTLLQKTAPTAFYQDSLNLTTGMTLNRQSFIDTLVQHHYERVETVREPGQFAVRGYLVDLFSTAHPEPMRLEFDDNQLAGIRLFNSEDQLSHTQTDRLQILPGREYPHDTKAIQRARRRWRQRFGSQRGTCFYQRLESLPTSGMEFYMALAHEEPLASWFDYCPDDHRVIMPRTIDWAQHQIQIEQRHAWRQLDHDQPPLALEEAYHDAGQIEAHCQQKAFTIALTDNAHFEKLPQQSSPLVQWHDRQLLQFQKWIEDHNHQAIHLFVPSPQRRRLLAERTGLKGIEESNRWQPGQPGNIYLYQHRLPGSFHHTQYGFLLDEHDLFGSHESTSSQPQIHQNKDISSQNKSHQPTTSQHSPFHAHSFEPGQLVIHERYGIGRYQGLQTLTVHDCAQDYLILKYDQGDTVYVSIDEIEAITPYHHLEDEEVRLHALGSKRWQNSKTQAWRKAYDYAARLLTTQASRLATTGHACQKPNDNHARFCAECEYELTPDQVSTCEAIFADMRDQKPMDRLVCGDVGFGKTEVAMRAAMLAIENQRQVVVLVPTTVLAMQHGETFQARFHHWPINIATLTRMSSATQAKLKAVEQGGIDIVIGTHRLLSSDVKVPRLGLIIIDEEHRFGVKDKERLKRHFAQVDVLSLSATPIPRSLNMAMGDLRDLSIIATPPAERQHIVTHVYPQHDSWLIEAISRERQRGGQIYYVINDIAKLPACERHLKKLFTDMSTITAHGQMPKRQLESIMSAFYQGEIECLITTTIIESGINIPRANTIIIERADRFGLAQLHQLRGRVGRSHQQGYAYLLTPPDCKLPKNAERRLQAIAHHTTLGAGFRLAMDDLEIRGGGELLGKEQSGHVDAIGMTLYTRLLQKALHQIQQNPDQHLSCDCLDDLLNEDDNHEIDIAVSHAISSDYIEDVNTRIEFYRAMANASDDDDDARIMAHLHDRFGTPPIAVKHLFVVNRIKRFCRQHGIAKLRANQDQVTLIISESHDFNITALMQGLGNGSLPWQLHGQMGLRHRFEESVSHATLLNQLETLLASLPLQPKSEANA